MWCCVHIVKVCDLFESEMTQYELSKESLPATLSVSSWPTGHTSIVTTYMHSTEMYVKFMLDHFPKMDHLNPSTVRSINMFSGLTEMNAKSSMLCKGNLSCSYAGWWRIKGTSVHDNP